MPFVVRPAAPDDLPALGRLGAELMKVHYDFDRRRFLEPLADAPEGYAWFLGTQLRESDVRVTVADDEGRILGYAYVAVEPRSWQMLLDEAGVIHDVIVDRSARGRGVATALIDDAFAWFRSRGIERVILHTAQANVSAQRLFEHLGFRRTMVEMTKELTFGGRGSRLETGERGPGE
jgi:ribosomal protein S18 acetylase RimI-like enzyme